MRKPLVRLVTIVVFALGAVSVVFVLGMRKKSPAVVNTVRGLGRSMRPMALKGAGTSGAYASVIRHVGRSSGRTYDTPIVAVPTEGGFVIALPYGRSSDWLKNLMAKGSAVIVSRGDTFDVDEPEIVKLEAVVDRFAPNEQRMHRLFGVDECVVVRRVDGAA
jgi:deazaflavin-dependent oxidoreductase (nitroreductase family)